MESKAVGFVRLQSLRLWTPIDGKVMTLTVLFRDEIEGANLDVAIGTINVPQPEIQPYLGQELNFIITEPKSNILPYHGDDTGVLVELTSQRRYQFKVIHSTNMPPYEGYLKVLAEVQPKLNTIYTIGYGNRAITEFIDLLKKYNILYVADIRSAAYSKYNADFSQEALKQSLRDHRIGYIFMGEQLGGRPKDEAYYTDGKVDYSKLGQADFYKQGVQRLNVALEKRLSVALMCSEQKPEMCHRSKLIGQTLFEAKLEVWHIDEHGELKTQPEVINRLTNGQLSMFESGFTSRKNYLPKEL